MGIVVDGSSVFPAPNDEASRRKSKPVSSKSWAGFETTEASGSKVLHTDKLGDYHVHHDGRMRKHEGLHWVLASLFVFADMAGGGIVALPTAVVRSEFWVGLCILCVMAIMATTSAVMLGKAWVILLRRFPSYRTHCRKPYAAIGKRALGKRMMVFVSVCVNLTQFGASTVFLLLTAKNTNDFLRAFFNVEIGYCLLVIIVAVALFPILLLKSPQDFWPVVVGGMMSTAIAVLLICIGAAFDFSTCVPQREFAPFKLTNMFLALGTILFTYGGHSAFPTIQHDMRKPAEFNKSAMLAFLLITLGNMTAVLLGGITYGNSLRDSVINSIQTFWIQQAVNMMITAHCVLTLTLIINPLNQEVEEMLKIEQGFGLKRILVRAGVLGIVVLMAETLPSFGVVLDLIGGSTVTLTSIVFPCLFYLYLAAGERKSKEPEHLSDHEPVSFMEMVRRTDKFTLFYCGLISALGTIAGVIATITAMWAILNTHFIAPCYVQPFLASEPTSTNASKTLAFTNCCGPMQNISRVGAYYCTKPELNFY